MSCVQKCLVLCWHILCGAYAAPLFPYLSPQVCFCCGPVGRVLVLVHCFSLGWAGMEDFGSCDICLLICRFNVTCAEHFGSRPFVCQVLLVSCVLWRGWDGGSHPLCPQVSLIVFLFSLSFVCLLLLVYIYIYTSVFVADDMSGLCLCILFGVYAGIILSSRILGWECCAEGSQSRSF